MENMLRHNDEDAAPRREIVLPNVAKIAAAANADDLNAVVAAAAIVLVLLHQKLALLAPQC